MSTPDFSDRLAADQGDALVRAYAGDPDVAAYYTEGVRDAEESDGWIGTVTPPALLVALDALELSPETAGFGTLTTIFRVTSVTAKRNAPGTARWQRARIFLRLARLSWGEEFGVLRDTEGNRLTEAIVRFQRFGAVRFGPDETIRADMLIGFDATVQIATMEFFQ